MNYFTYFSCKEFFPSCTDAEIAKCFKDGLFDNLLTLLQVLDCFRDSLGYPIIITSTYRDWAHNMCVGGSSTSQHMAGSAIDFKCSKVPFDSLVHLFDVFLQKSALSRYVGQVLCYHKSQFIHFALRTPKHPFLLFKHYEQRDN